MDTKIIERLRGYLPLGDGSLWSQFSKDIAIAADTIEEAALRTIEEAALRTRLSTLLAETAVALKGEEAALHRHSWHDLPVIALEKMVLIEQLNSLCNQMGEAMNGAALHYTNDFKNWTGCREALAAWRQRKEAE